MLKRTLILVTVLVLVLTACAAALADTMWIKTNNGKPANARSEPNVNSSLVAEFAYGSEVYTMGTAPVNGYTELSNGGGMWVLTRFLVSSKPAPFVPSKDDGKKSSSSKSSGDAQSEIYNEFKAAVWVTPYTIRTSHPRSSGVVNMRFAPSKNAPLIESFKTGKSLTVLCELKNWIEVQDPDTGKVGYIHKNYLQR